MLKWIKNIFNESNIEAKQATSEPIKVCLVDNLDELTLVEDIQVYLEQNGPASTMEWLLERLVEKMSGTKGADIFTNYYNNSYSKRDIIDKYDEIITVDEAAMLAIAKLGQYYKAETIEALYADPLNFHVISADFMKELLEQVAQNAISMKQIHNLVYEEYFYFIKSNLSLADKIKANNNIVVEEEPIDEIEATLIKLLLAERAH